MRALGKMVSTRVCRPRFSEGEYVLCYEPDPTKSNVLYNAKIIRFEVYRDEKGRRVPHYYVHFHGWSRSWDRWVEEHLIVEDTPVNRELQEKLKNHSLKLLSKKRSSASLSESLSKRSTTDMTSIQCKPGDSKKPPDDLRRSSRHEDAKKPIKEEKPIATGMFTEVEFPANLKAVMETDCLNINRKSKLVRLPRSPNIVAILDGYLESCRHDSLVISEGSFNLTEEVIGGLKTYIDWFLPSHLLYSPEHSQCKQIQQTYSHGSSVSMAAAVASTQADHSYNKQDFDLSIVSTVRNDEALDSDEDIDILGVGPQDCSTPMKTETDALRISTELNSLDKPVPFVEIYGIEHLLRLFVRLPYFLSHTEITKIHYDVLCQQLDRLLMYLSDNFDVFPSGDYITQSNFLRHRNLTY